MDISVTEFKAHCLDIIRRVERDREPVVIKRRGKTVAKLVPPPKPKADNVPPWEHLRSLGGQLLASPEESVIHDSDFEALR